MTMPRLGPVDTAQGPSLLLDTRQSRVKLNFRILSYYLFLKGGKINNNSKYDVDEDERMGKSL